MEGQGIGRHIRRGSFVRKANLLPGLTTLRGCPPRVPPGRREQSIPHQSNVMQSWMLNAMQHACNNSSLSLFQDSASMKPGKKGQQRLGSTAGCKWETSSTGLCPRRRTQEEIQQHRALLSSKGKVQLNLSHTPAVIYYSSCWLSTQCAFWSKRGSGNNVWKGFQHARCNKQVSACYAVPLTMCACVCRPERWPVTGWTSVSKQRCPAATLCILTTLRNAKPVTSGS
jgi:hypothetical protein